jgi:glycerol-3-phosphate dehydrogenase (NAD(P)+)
VNIAILGAGAWGSALAIALARAHRVRLWARGGDDRGRLRNERRSRYLPEGILPAEVGVASSIREAVADTELVIVATSTAGLREVVSSVASNDPSAHVVWVCKGFEHPRFQLPHEIVAGLLPASTPVGVLSGPSFAAEVAAGLPTALVLASRDAAFAERAMAELNGPRLRVYSSDDVIGVELGGAVKNVIAIASGICDGLALGRNARAALITRGLAEVVRLGVAMGGQAETFMGLAGVGDLVLTCTGDLSRNRAVGVELGRGRPLDAILAGLGHVAEGVLSAPAVRAHAERLRIEMPITEAVCEVLAGRLPPRDAAERLLAREPRPE